MWIRASRADVNFYVSPAVASGTGRVLLPIARAGIEITGLALADKCENAVCA